jgi:hypothetical protein
MVHSSAARGTVSLPTSFIVGERSECGGSSFLVHRAKVLEQMGVGDAEIGAAVSYAIRGGRREGTHMCGYKTCVSPVPVRCRV